MSVTIGDSALALLASAIEEQVLILGPGGVEYATQTARELFGRSLEELRRLGPESLLAPGPAPAAADECSEIDGRVLIPNGNGPLVKGMAFGLQDNKQLWVIRGRATLMDLGSLTAGLMHNLSTPLSTIRSSAELMGRLLETAKSRHRELEAEMAAWPRSARQGLDAIIGEVDRISLAMTDLLAKVKGDWSQKTEMLDINQILATEAQALINGLGHRRTTELSLDLDQSLPRVPGLYSDFSHSFANLIKNALRAMSGSPQKLLGLSTGLSDGCITVAVSDTGSGIAEDKIGQIFQPFFTSSKKNEPGLGLGLHSVRQLLVPYKATINVESQPGRTVFTVRIPVSG